MKLEKDERLDELQINGYKIIQNTREFCFGIDSVLLTDFAKTIRKNSEILDLGAGTGVISILLCAKTNPKKIMAIEKQQKVYQIIQKNIKLNKLEEKMGAINDDILNLEKYFPKNHFDSIITNPPYKKHGTGIKNENNIKYIARHETTATLKDFIEIAGKLLKDNGKFFIINKVERLIDMTCYMRKYKIEPKRMQFILPDINKEPKLVMIEGIKCGKPFLKIDKNIIVNGNKI